MLKNVFSALLLIGLFTPTIIEAKTRCKRQDKVVVCKLPKRKKCNKKNPCIPKGYYRPTPPRVIPML